MQPPCRIQDGAPTLCLCPTAPGTSMEAPELGARTRSSERCGRRSGAEHTEHSPGVRLGQAFRQHRSVAIRAPKRHLTPAHFTRQFTQEFTRQAAQSKKYHKMLREPTSKNSRPTLLPHIPTARARAELIASPPKQMSTAASKKVLVSKSMSLELNKENENIKHRLDALRTGGGGRGARGASSRRSRPSPQGRRPPRP